MEKNEIEMIAPIFANTNLDIPALTADIQKIFSRDCYAVIDVGGDDAGAIALGRYSKFLKNDNYSVYFLLNKFRYLQEDLNNSETIELIKSIEMVSKLKVNYLINTSNLSKETTAENIIDGIKYSKNLSDEIKLPLVCNAVLNSVDCDKLMNIENKFICERFIKAPWEK
ncbi:MAG: hypothetical protein RR549_05445 [Oscillospiraceae bacterium]